MIPLFDLSFNHTCLPNCLILVRASNWTKIMGKNITWYHSLLLGLILLGIGNGFHYLSPSNLSHYMSSFTYIIILQSILLWLPPNKWIFYMHLNRFEDVAQLAHVWWLESMARLMFPCYLQRYCTQKILSTS